MSLEFASVPEYRNKYSHLAGPWNQGIIAHQTPHFRRPPKHVNTQLINHRVKNNFMHFIKVYPSYGSQWNTPLPSVFLNIQCSIFRRGQTPRANPHPPPGTSWKFCIIFLLWWESTDNQCIAFMPVQVDITPSWQNYYSIVLLLVSICFEMNHHKPISPVCQMFHPVWFST